MCAHFFLPSPTYPFSRLQAIKMTSFLALFAVVSMFFVLVLGASTPSTCPINAEGCSTAALLTTQGCTCASTIQQCKPSGGSCVGPVCSGVCEFTSAFYGIVIGIPLLIIALVACCCCMCCGRGGGGGYRETILLVAPQTGGYSSIPSRN